MLINVTSFKVRFLSMQFQKDLHVSNCSNIVKLNCAFINVQHTLNQDVRVCFIQEFNVTFEVKLNSKETYTQISPL